MSTHAEGPADQNTQGRRPRWKTPRIFEPWFDTALALALFRKKLPETPTGISFWAPMVVTACVFAASDNGIMSPWLAIVSAPVLMIMCYGMIAMASNKTVARTRFYWLAALVSTIGIFTMGRQTSVLSIASMAWVALAWLYQYITKTK